MYFPEDLENTPFKYIISNFVAFSEYSNFTNSQPPHVNSSPLYKL